MTSDRPYARRKSVSEAIEEMRRFAGTQFDPQVVAALRAILREPARREQRTPAARSSMPRTRLPTPR
jgi:HD-GYP domain-containing protein (c-di-GMP phosphodiesterase class II)